MVFACSSARKGEEGGRKGWGKREEEEREEEDRASDDTDGESAVICG